jgi:uncharacterized membrane protein YphA (DoxX/SURF4 family)
MGEIIFVGRVLFAGIFLYSAGVHLTQTGALVEIARSKKVPFPKVATVGGGIFLLAGSLSLLLGVFADLGALLLAVFLIPTAVFMHGFWNETGEARNTEITQFLKDMALAGAAILFAVLISHTGPDIALMITDPLLDLREK